MTLHVYELHDDTYDKIGRVEDGEIVDGADELTAIYPAEAWQEWAEEKLAARLNGPRVMATVEDDDPMELTGELDIPADSETEKTASTPYDELMAKTDTDTTEKEWERYEGPQGGEGWKNPRTDEIRYQEHKPTSDRPNGAAHPGPNDVRSEDPEAAAVTGRIPGTESEFASVEPGDVVAVDATDFTGEFVVTDLSHGQNGEGPTLLYGHPVGEPEKEGQVAVNQAVFNGIVDRSEDARDGPGDDVTLDWATERAIDVDWEWSEIDSIGEDFKQEVFRPGVRVALETAMGDTVEAKMIEVTTTNGEITGAKVKLPKEKYPQSVEDILNGNTFNEYEIEAIEDWDAFSEAEKREAAVTQYEHGTSKTQMPRNTQQAFDQQVKDNIIPAFRDADHLVDVMGAFYLVRNRVSRASCRGLGGFSIRVSSDADPETTNHEFGHGLMNGHRMTYKESARNTKPPGMDEEKWDRRPTNLSHEFHDIRVTRDRSGWDEEGGIPFDFSDDSPFWDPEGYMFRRDHTEETAEIDPELDPVELDEGDFVTIETGRGYTTTYELSQVNVYDRFGVVDCHVRGEIGNLRISKDGRVIDSPDTPDRTEAWEDAHELESDVDTTEFDAVATFEGAAPAESDPYGYDEWRDTVITEIGQTPGLTELDYDPIEGGDQLHAEFESLAEGDVVKFNVKKESATSDEITEETRYLTFKGKRKVWEEAGKTDYRFETEDGGRWEWSVYHDDRGLDTNTGTTVAGVARNPSLDPDEWTADMAANPDHPLAPWRGFNTTATTTDEKVENLASACNRAWFKAAKLAEEDPFGFETESANIGSHYSVSNSHETMAKTFEMLRTADDSNGFEIYKMVGEHPYLVSAALELVQPSDVARDKLEELDANPDVAWNDRGEWL